MWLLIECDDLMDAGKNEKQRIIVKNNLFQIKNTDRGEVIFTGEGSYLPGKVHISIQWRRKLSIDYGCIGAGSQSLAAT